MVSVCNRDCFNCTFDDCILDVLDAEDYKEQRRIEKEILLPKSEKEKELAAKRRAYYEANKEELAAYQRAYREANKERLRAYGREHMRARRQKEKEALVW